MQTWIFNLVENGGYGGIAFLMMLETVFPPIPSEVIMPVAGVVAASGTLSLAGCVAAGTLGAMVGNIFWYVVARIVGIDRFKAFILRSGRWLTLDWSDIETARIAFGRFGNIIVLVGRMVPSIRSVVSIPAGLLRMKFSTFLVWSTIGTLIWTAGLAGAGWAAGRHIDRIEDVMGPISLGIVVVIFCMYVWRQINWSKRARRTTTSLTDGKA